MPPFRRDERAIILFTSLATVAFLIAWFHRDPFVQLTHVTAFIACLGAIGKELRVW